MHHIILTSLLILACLTAETSAYGENCDYNNATCQGYIDGWPGGSGWEFSGCNGRCTSETCTATLCGVQTSGPNTFCGCEGDSGGPDCCHLVIVAGDPNTTLTHGGTCEGCDDDTGNCVISINLDPDPDHFTARCAPTQQP